MIFIFQQLTGGYAVIFYAIKILKIGEKFNSNNNEYGALFMIGAIRFAMSIFSALQVL